MKFRAFLILLLRLSCGCLCAREPPPREIRGIHANKMTNESMEKILNGLRNHAGDGTTVVGFIASTDESLLANPSSVQKMLSGLSSLSTYLKETSIDKELEAVLNPRLADNIAILGAIQRAVLDGRDRRDSLLSSMTVDELTSKFTLEESARYVRYALAAYGDAAINAANTNEHVKMDVRLGVSTKMKVSKHIGIPQDDLIIVDLDYKGNYTELRHFVAVDHENEKVVLAIRGTFSASECVVDIDGYSRPFCGGQAHAGFAVMAERLWNLLAHDILTALQANDGYELIITGHSLGAGVALLLNVMLRQDDRMNGISFRTFAFASPPVFAPLSKARPALRTAVNYMHDKDDVPFLSGDCIRHQVACLTAIDKDCKGMSLEEKGKLILGQTKPSMPLIRKANKAFRKRLPKKQGMPVLMAPVMGVAWACEKGDTDTWDLKICDPAKLAKSEILMDAESPLDHYPTRYERAFTNIKIDTFS